MRVASYQLLLLDLRNSPQCSEESAVSITKVFPFEILVSNDILSDILSQSFSAVRQSLPSAAALFETFYWPGTRVQRGDPSMNRFLLTMTLSWVLIHCQRSTGE